jgi:3-oxoacyl-[acyl-carrier-protein] synthase II
MSDVESSVTAAPPGRAVITGLGVLGPLGSGREAFLEGVREGRSGIDRIRSFDPSPFRTPYGGEVRGLDLEAELGPGESTRYADPYLHFALVAARQALGDAGLEWSRDRPPPRRAAIVAGTCNGGLRSAERQYAILAGKAPGSFDRETALLIRYHALGKALGHALGVTGPIWVTTTACSSSTGALGLALELIAHRVVDVALAGGADVLCLATMAGFDALKATSTDRIAPFSLPVGLNLGEGAAFFVLESAEHAAARGARVEGEVLACAFTADAHHPTAPDPRGDGAFRTMTAALERAALGPGDVGCVNLHGTGTEANDRTEARAVARVFGDRPVPVHSFKSQVGHCLGAAGALEAAAGLLAMNAGVIPATINFTEPRPGCTLDCVPNTPRPARYDRFLSCNYAFGGHNAGVAIGVHDPARPPAAGPDPGRRTVLTGGGALTSLGLGSRALLDSLRRGRSGLSPAAGRTELPTVARLGGWVPLFADRDVDRRLDTRAMNPLSRFATVAARLALLDAGLRVGPRDGERTGVINGVFVGPSEEEHMRAVTRSGGAEAEIAGFSTIVANSTAGWVSNALLLKGSSLTVSQGADAGLFALAAAHLLIGSGHAPCLLAGAADELYSRYFINCDELHLLHTGADEERYRLVEGVDDRRVLAEGAAYLVAEERETARARGARILAEVAGFGQTFDPSGFLESSTDVTGLADAVTEALGRAGWSADDVGLVTWSPQGNRRDLATIEALKQALGERGARIPLVTSVFHTGLAESASGTATLAAVLASWADGGGLWPQRTGLSRIDGRPLPDRPVKTLALAASDLGYHLALALAPEAGGAA